MRKTIRAPAADAQHTGDVRVPHQVSLHLVKPAHVGYVRLAVGNQRKSVVDLVDLLRLRIGQREGRCILHVLYDAAAAAMVESLGNRWSYYISAEEYGSKFFSNGARPSGILTHPNTVKDPAALRASWNAAYGGASNASRVAVLEEGMTFAPLSMPNNEAQFLETRRFQVEEICRIYRVPPHMVGDLSRATFSNIEHSSIDFAVHTIRPWLVRIEQAMNRALFPDREKGRFYVQFNLDGLMRGDYKSRMEGYAIARQNGWMSANDIRELENQNPIPAEDGGDAYLCNGNMIPIKMAGNTLTGAEAPQRKESE